MPNQWGFINIPRGIFDATMRGEFLIGYPLGFSIPIVPPVLINIADYRAYFADALDISGGIAVQATATYDNLPYLKDYI